MEGPEGPLGQQRSSRRLSNSSVSSAATVLSDVPEIDADIKYRLTLAFVGHSALSAVFTCSTTESAGECSQSFSQSQSSTAVPSLDSRSSSDERSQANAPDEWLLEISPAAFDVAVKKATEEFLLEEEQRGTLADFFRRLDELVEEILVPGQKVGGGTSSRGSKRSNASRGSKAAAGPGPRCLIQVDGGNFAQCELWAVSSFTDSMPDLRTSRAARSTAVIFILELDCSEEQVKAQLSTLELFALDLGARKKKPSAYLVVFSGPDKVVSPEELASMEAQVPYPFVERFVLQSMRDGTGLHGIATKLANEQIRNLDNESSEEEEPVGKRSSTESRLSTRSIRQSINAAFRRRSSGA